VLVQNWPPHLALSPLAMCDPPLMPFRDAGYSQADFILNVQDVVYGVWKAKEKGLVNLREFCLEEYANLNSATFRALTPGVQVRKI
jgi:cell division cycle 14